MRQYRLVNLLSSLAAIIISGTVFFRIVEGWSWVDSYFFTVVTISTVGYGQLVPATAVGKIAATVLIFSGIGVFALAIQRLAETHMRHREAHTEILVARLGQTSDEMSRSANEDDPPSHGA